MVTTDGHRLSKMETLVRGREGTVTFLIPLKGVLELKRLCDEAATEAKAEGGSDVTEIKISHGGPNAFFDLPGMRFSVKLVDAQFPPYQQVIPEHSEHIVRAGRAELADALKAVSVAASDRTGGIRLTLAASKMRFESESPRAARASTKSPWTTTGRRSRSASTRATSSTCSARSTTRTWSSA